MDIKNTYFGFTDNLTALQKGKVEKSLNRIFEYNGQFLMKKELIYKQLKEGHKPQFEENYSYYSIRKDDYTKPKTLYKIEDMNDETYIEITKTDYNYALYLIGNGLLDSENSQAFINNEIKQEEERLKQEEEKQQKEREKQEQEKVKREQRRKEKIENWTEKGKAIIERNNINLEQIITDVYLQNWKNIASYFPDTSKDDLFSNMKNIKETYYQVIGNENYSSYWLNVCLNEMQERHYDLNIKQLLECKILQTVFNVKDEDKSRTITAKVKAVHENKEYKGGAKQEPKTFYYLDKGSFHEVTANYFKVEGYTLFLMCNEETGTWRVIEAKTGAGIASEKSKQKAKEKGKENIINNKERLESSIQSCINQYGVSPLYETKNV